MIEFLFYVELLLFLAGALIYGFLTRELLRRPEVLPGNLPLRATLVAMTVFYAGTLADSLSYLLFGTLTGSPAASLGTALDLVRGCGWLLALPLLLHTLERAGRLELDRPRPGVKRLGVKLLVAAGYLPLALFLLPLFRFAAARQPLLADLARQLEPSMLVLGLFTLLPAAWLASDLARRAPGRRLGRFLRWLAVLLLVHLAALAVAVPLDPWRTDAAGADRLLRFLLMVGLLLPGCLFVLHVQRFNLLRLSVSNRILRSFLAVVLLASLALLISPAAAGRQVVGVRQLVAWGMLAALVVGLGYRPLRTWALDSSPRLRALLGESITPRELDRFLASLQRLEGDEAELLQRTADQLGAWLGTEVVLLDDGDDVDGGGDAGNAGGSLDPLRQHFESQPEAAAVLRLDPPSRPLAILLARRGLHAVFALRVGDTLERLIGVAASATGGGYSDGEIEAVRLVLRQVAALIALKRQLAGRLREERRLAERERLSLLGLVSAALAHEIKNPLSAMKSLAQTLAEELAATAPESEGVVDLELIVEQIDRLDQTTREILGLARPREGEGCRLGELAAGALYILQAEARKRGVELDGGAVEEVGEVGGSAATWQTVVFNLVLNALEHTAAGGRVEVGLRRRSTADGGEEVELTSANPGGPLSDEEAARLFEPFVSAGGTGLGLPLVARRVEQLGGRIEAGSDGGTIRFQVRVPAGAER